MDYKEMGRLGGVESGRVRRARSRKHGFRETIVRMLNDPEALVREDLTAGEQIARQLILQASEGNIKAAEFLRDTVGEKPGAKPAADTSAGQVHEIRIRVVE